MIFKRGTSLKATLERGLQRLTTKAHFVRKHALRYLRRVYDDYWRTHRFPRPKRRTGHTSYTVISAAYNAEPYLEAYFTSLCNQILDFERHLHLVLVDDGSTDGTADVIRAWQKKFPRNIRYIYQENAGQGAARNAGLAFAATPWVTFIDPDDFVDPAYFQRIDRFLARQSGGQSPQDFALVCCNYIPFYEHSGRFLDKHALKHRFLERETILPFSRLDEVLQLSVNSALFRREDIEANGLRFDERRWPQFEDTHFVLRYLCGLGSGAVAYLREARYYYRKRANLSSSLDTAKRKKAYYTTLLREGILEALQAARRDHGAVPGFMRRTLLYVMSYYVRDLTSRPPLVALSAKETKECFALCRQIFGYLDREDILTFPSEWTGLTWGHKCGVLVCFKGEDPPHRVLTERWDGMKRELCLVYWRAGEREEVLLLDGRPVSPRYAGTTDVRFMGRHFVWQRRLWVHVPETASTLELLLDGQPVRFGLSGSGSLRLCLGEALAALAPPPRPDGVYSGAWLLMDRHDQADDNAEHLYRFIRKHAPDTPLWFVLDPASHDWPRLRAEGFSLLAFGGPEHEKALRQCAKLVSSHLDNYVTDYFPGLLENKHFVFLQHGVTKDDISAWLNGKKIDLLLAASPREYQSLVEDGGPYVFCAKHVALTGFPRHDALLADAGAAEKLILVMPTWRRNLVGEKRGTSSPTRRTNPAFINSVYARAWQGFLASPRLKELLERYGYDLIFFPHSNVQPYLPLFSLEPHIQVVRHRDARIQDLFRRSALLITDFSSVAFEMAYLGRPVLYYQFDRKSVFSGRHLTQPGYFDYFADGFGPVLLREEELLEALDALLKRGALPEPEYLERMERTFAFRDGGNCLRAFKAIQSLDCR